MLWLGYASTDKLRPTGFVKAKKNQVRRRFQTSSEFLPVEQQQTIYSRDTLMTGQDGGMVVVLNDGTLIEMGPDSMVEIKMKDEAAGLSNLEFIIDVKKGQVRGDSPHQSTTLTGTQDATGLPELLKGGLGDEARLALNVGEKAKTTTCSVSELKTASPFDNEDELAVIDGMLQCHAGETSYLLRLENEAGQKIHEEKIIPNFINSMRFSIPVSAPGKYKLAGKEIVVAQDYEGIAWNSPPLTCDRHLSYHLEPSLKIKSITEVMVHSGTKTLSALDWQKTAILPSLIQLTAENKNHFKLRSSPLSLTQWRDCPTLKNPVRNTIFNNNTHIILFTWVQADGRSYVFELTADPEFKKIIKSEKTAKNFSQLKDLKKGKFYWRVRSLKTGDLSEIFEFEIH